MNLITRLDNFKFNPQELVDYYNQLEVNYQDMKWAVADHNIQIDSAEHNAGGFYNWAIQTDLKDSSKPCPAYEIGLDKSQVDILARYAKPTKLIFGFAEKLLSRFLDASQTLVVVHPPGCRLGFHIDTGDYVKIHIPIKTNNESIFEYENESFKMEVGYAYMARVDVPHATNNLGNSDRVHLIFRVPTHLADFMKTTKFNL